MFAYVRLFVRLMLLARGMMFRGVVAVVGCRELKALASGVLLRLRELVNKAARERILADIKPVARGRGWDMYRSINWEVRDNCFQMPADDLTNVMDACSLLEMAVSPSPYKAAEQRLGQGSEESFADCLLTSLTRSRYLSNEGF
jgi:hypothetical protein